jgi:hypothetical protein
MFYPKWYFFMKGVKIGKLLHWSLHFKNDFDHKIINLYLNLTKTLVLLMMSTCKVAFNIDYLIIHTTVNIHVPQSLFCLPNVSLNTLNKDTCWYEQL